VSLVSYKLTSSNTLQRSDLDVPWTGAGAQNIAFRRYGTPLVNVTPQENGPRCRRLRYCFRRADGTLIAPRIVSSTSQQYHDTIRRIPWLAVDVCLAVIGKERFTQPFLAPSDEYPDGAGQCPHGNNLNNSNGTLTSKSIKAIWIIQTLPSFYTPPSSYPKDIVPAQDFRMLDRCRRFKSKVKSSLFLPFQRPQKPRRHGSDPHPCGSWQF